MLSATSEPVPGLEGPSDGAGAGLVAWRPAGNLLAAVKKYGYDGGAEGEGGKEGRRDVVFFERNGLVHGGFRLREDERVRRGEGDAAWEVRGLAYCSSSEVLAVHIQRRDTDVGESYGKRLEIVLIRCSATMDNEQLSLLPEIRVFPASRHGRNAALHLCTMASGKGECLVPRWRG